MKTHLGADAPGLVHRSSAPPPTWPMSPPPMRCSMARKQTGSATRAIRACTSAGMSACALQEGSAGHGVAGRLFEKYKQGKARMRENVEHPFHLVKDLFCHRMTRYRGIA